MSNGWSNWHQIWYTCADSSGNGYIRQTNCPERHKRALGWGLWGQIFKRHWMLSNGWTDWHQLWFTSADSSGNGHRLNANHPSMPQVACRGGGVRGSHIQKVSGSCQTAGPIGTKFGTPLWIHLGMDIGSNN